MDKVAVVVGSIASGSINKKLAHAIAKLGAERLCFEFLPIEPLPMYDYETKSEQSEPGRQFKAALEAADGVLVVTPEYLRSIPGCLKNALDLASRPYGHSSLHDKPTAVCGATQGAIGTACAQQHLRLILSHMGAVTMPTPEMFIQLKPGMIADDFTVTDERMRDFLSGFVDKFAAWIAQQKK
jgi:chromate reductase, NAD(P)H dehydrogenase (quinone)